MLKTIRQFQRGILILVAIIIVVAFSFLPGMDLDLGVGKVGSNTCVAKVGGKCIQDNEAVKLVKIRDLALNLSNAPQGSSTLDMSGFVQAMSSAQQGLDMPTNYVSNIMVLRRAGKELDVEPSEKDIRKAAGELYFFPRGGGGDLEQWLSGLGLTEADFSRLISDCLIFQNLKNLVGAGAQSSTKVAENFYILQNRRYTASKVSFLRDDYKDKVELSDERIKQYFDDRNGSNVPVASAEFAEQTNPDEVQVAPLMTEETRSFNYVRIAPPKPADEASAKDQNDAELNFTRLVNNLYKKLIKRKSDFVAAANEEAAIGHTSEIIVKEFTDISRENLPFDFDNQPGIYLDLFKQTMKQGDVSIPFKNEEGNYFILQLKNITAPRQMTFEEAKPKIVETLTESELDKIVADAASEAKANLQEALKAGKTITVAAAEKGLTLVSLPEFSATDTPEDFEDPGLILESVRELSAGEISGVSNLNEGKGTFITHVSDITIHSNEKKDDDIKKIAEEVSNFESNMIFQSWFTNQVKKANPEYKNSVMVHVNRAR